MILALLLAASSWVSTVYDEPCAEGNHLCEVVCGDAVNATTNWVKAEGRRLMLPCIVTAPGQFVTNRFVVNTRTNALKDGSQVKMSSGERPKKGHLHERWDDHLTLLVMSKGGRAALKGPPPAGADTKGAAASAPPVTTVFLAGDSTVCCYNTEPYGTWGQMLPAFFDETVAIANHAECGRTLASFKGEKREAKVLELAKPGDWLFIQFGHNDQKETDRHRKPLPFEERMANYNTRLNALIDDFEAKGGHVALVSPMERLRWNAKGEQERSLQEFQTAMRELAAKRHLPFIDLQEMSYTLYGAKGAKGSEALFGFRKGALDRTHPSVYGGYELARCVVEGIKANIPELSVHLRKGVATERFDPAHPDPDPQIPRSGHTAKAKPEEK